MADKKLQISNHDAYCVEWYRRLIADGTAEDGQRIAVQMHDEAMRLQSENTRLKAERDKAVEDLRSCRRNKCDYCYYSNKNQNTPCGNCQPPIINCGDRWKWRGLEEDCNG